MSISLTSGSYLICPVCSSLLTLNPSLKTLPSTKLSCYAPQQKQITVVTFLFVSVLFCVDKSEYNIYRTGTLCALLEQQRHLQPSLVLVLPSLPQNL